MKIKTTVQAVVVSVAAALFTQLPAHASPGAVSFTSEQQAAIGQIAADYLREHPDLLVEMSEKLQQREHDAEQRQALDVVLAQQKVCWMRNRRRPCALTATSP